MESHYLRTGVKLPKIDLQRISIHDSCLEKMKTKFSSLDDENQLYMLVGLLLYRYKTGLSPLEDTKKSIVAALSETSESLTTQEIFTGRTICIFSYAFTKMGKKDEKGMDTKIIMAMQCERKFKQTGVRIQKRLINI